MCALVLAIVLVCPATVYGANPYGQVFAGQAKCLSCHGNLQGRWQVGSYTGTAHDRFVTDVQAAPASILPTAGSTLWSSPSPGGGLTFGPTDVWLLFGGPGQIKEYVSVFRNDATHTLSTGKTMAPVAGPSDDYLLFDPISFDPNTGAWEVGGVVGARTYFQGCGGCHNLGVTRPADTTYTLASGATMGRFTPTAYSGVGIQCENCHGTGSARSNHWSTGVEIVRTKRVLDSRTCAQCHVSGTAKEKNFAGKTFSQPNGFTTDKRLEDFYDVLGAQYVKTSPTTEPPAIPSTDAKFYPDGHNKGMNHGYYNEYMLSAHARSLRYPGGQLFSSKAKSTCLRCHSGEGFLKSIGYGSDGPNDIGVFASSVASDTLDIECAVCHTVHAKTGDALGLRLPEDELCAACHSGGLTPGAEAAPGTLPKHSAQEMLAGYGLVGVPRPAERFMGDATCVDCHMPVTRESRASHRFTPMLPGDAEAWGVRTGGDSCTPCHPSASRAHLQADVDRWQSSIGSAMTAANAAVAAARARPASATPAGSTLILSAETNIALVSGDGSLGVHNYPYASAGLSKAAYFAKAVGARFSSFGVTAYDPLRKTSITYGRLVFGDGSTRAGERVVIEARPGGVTAWSAVGTAITLDSGDFAFAAGPTGTTSYRARWTAKDDATKFVSGEGKVTIGSTTTIKVSPTSVVRGGPVSITGAVSPAHTGMGITIQFRSGSGSWRALSTRALSLKGGYSATWRPSTVGTWYLRVVFAGDASHTGSTSATVKVLVR